MKVVVDTNIIFSILLSHSSKMRDMLWNKKYTFYSPNFVFVEIFKHKEKIMKFTKAYELCGGIDENDTPVVALALELNALLWTGDEKLKEGLKRKGFNRFFDFSH